MSLTKILNQSQTKTVLKPYIRAPKMPDRPKVVVEGSSNPSRMGAALDYAMRFGLQVRGGYPKQDELVAHDALGVVEKEPELRIYQDKAIGELKGGLEDVADLDASVELSERAARGCLRLAALDTVFRAHYVDELVSPPDESAIAELQALYRLIPWEACRAHVWGVLNPCFQLGSHLVGGADADFAFDGCLVEIKTIVKIRPAIEIVRQLVGYALLANRYGIEQAPDEARIEALGIYFSRAGHLFRFRLDECIDPEHHDLVLDHLTTQGGRRPLLPSRR